jgi:pimeloyl-ACP methyl ester carboxylesterase
MEVESTAAPPHDVLLLRGLGRESGHWLDFPQARPVTPCGCGCLPLALPGSRPLLCFPLTQLLQSQLGPCSKVYALDNVGVGTESHRRAPCSLPETVDDLLRRFDVAREADRRTGPWLAAGVSLGGMLALEIAGRNVPSCAGAVVANSSCTHLSWLFQRFRPAAFAAMLHAMAKCDLEEKERIMIPYTIHDQKKRDASHDARIFIARNRPLPMRTFLAQCIGAHICCSERRV